MTGTGSERAELTATEAARRLGVKRETLYAYVSRGLLTSRREPGGRESRFDPVEVRRLAERRRAGGRAGALEMVVDSGLTLIDPDGRLSYRGWDATDACRRSTYEDVAEWLWATGEQGAAFASEPVALEAATSALAALPGGLRPVERFRVVVATAATTDPLRFDRRPRALAATGRRIIGALVDAPGPEPRPAPATAGASVAERLFALVCPVPGMGTPARLRALEAALVLLADHEMASSTLAARVAASTWADPYLVVLAGMSVLGGPLHGGAGDRLVPLLHEARSAGAAVAVGERLRAGEQPGGFGHPVYREADPRAEALWPMLEAAWPADPVLEAAAAIVDVVRSQGDAFPNIDLALATLVACAGMVPGSAEAIFAVARCAGWLAHAMEEYPHRLRFRLRAAYTGPPPGPGPGA